MYIVNGVAHAGEATPVVKVNDARPLDDYRLWVRFNTGEAKIFDFKPLLAAPGFAVLKDERIFRQVHIDYGVTVWQDGDIDIAPEKLYKEGVAVGVSGSA
jgi:Protein of unknown function (DUF2442).